MSLLQKLKANQLAVALSLGTLAAGACGGKQAQPAEATGETTEATGAEHKCGAGKCGGEDCKCEGCKGEACTTEGCPCAKKEGEATPTEGAEGAGADKGGAEHKCGAGSCG